MRLKKVTGKQFKCTCVKCGKSKMTGDYSNNVFYADLDGQPFKDYYCNDCAYTFPIKCFDGQPQYFKTVEVEYTNNVKIITSVNAECSNDEIRNYFKVGSMVNVGDGANDRLEKIIKVDIKD